MLSTGCYYLIRCYSEIWIIFLTNNKVINLLKGSKSCNQFALACVHPFPPRRRVSRLLRRERQRVREVDGGAEGGHQVG